MFCSCRDGTDRAVAPSRANLRAASPADAVRELDRFGRGTFNDSAWVLSTSAADMTVDEVRVRINGELGRVHSEYEVAEALNALVNSGAVSLEAGRYRWIPAAHGR